MPRELTEHELRNQSGEIMRALDRGEEFVITRNGAAVGELRPCVTADSWPLTPRSPPSPVPPASMSAASGRTSTPRSTRTRRRAPESQPEQGLVDTSVVIDLEALDRASLPDELAISAVTLAELALRPPRDRRRRGARAAPGAPPAHGDDLRSAAARRLLRPGLWPRLRGGGERGPQSPRAARPRPAHRRHRDRPRASPLYAQPGRSPRPRRPARSGRGDRRACRVGELSGTLANPCRSRPRAS